MGYILFTSEWTALLSRDDGRRLATLHPMIPPITAAVATATAAIVTNDVFR
jgi:hypothetical protein